MKLAIDTKFGITQLVKHKVGDICLPRIYRISDIDVRISSAGIRIIYHVFDSEASKPCLEWFDEQELTLFVPPVIEQELPF